MNWFANGAAIAIDAGAFSSTANMDIAVDRTFATSVIAGGWLVVANFACWKLFLLIGYELLFFTKNLKYDSVVASYMIYSN